MTVIAAVWLGLVGAATAGWFGDGVLANRFSGNFLLPLLLLFVARRINRQTGSRGSENEAETVTDLLTPTGAAEPVERTSSATFKRRTPPSAPRQPTPTSVEDALKATRAPSSSDAERIGRPIPKSDKVEPSRPRTSAEMLEDAKKRFSSDA